MLVCKACKEINDDIFHLNVSLFQAHKHLFFAKISHILPHLYLDQIDKKLDKIMQKLAS